MTNLMTTPTLIVLSIIAYIFSSILITRYIINGGKNEKDIILQNKLKATKAKSFLKKYPEANVQSIRNFALAFGFIFAFAGSIFAFSVFGETAKPQVLSDPETEGPNIVTLIPPVRTKKQVVDKVIPPPPPPVQKDPNPTIITTPKDDFVEAKTPKGIDIDKPNDVIPSGKEDEYIEPTVTINFAEKMPRFKGCENLEEDEAYDCTMLKIQQYIATIDYPDYAIENDIEGKVFVSFIVNSKGEVTDVEVLGDKTDRSLNNISLKHMKKLPKFLNGGSQGGKEVNIKYNVPIVFKLNH